MTDWLCIYHKDCADGFTAAWAVWKRHGNMFDYHAASYSDTELPDFVGKRVVLADFCYPKAVLDEMLERGAKSILVLDHHKSAAGSLVGVPEAPSWDEWLINNDGKFACVFDMKRSGCGITWDHIHAGEVRSRIVDYVEDRDLWNFNLLYSKEINANIFSYEYTFASWESLSQSLVDDFNGFRLGGKAILRKHDRDVADIIRLCSRKMVIGGVEVDVVNATRIYASDVGNIMSVGKPFSASYFDSSSGREFSLRSQPDGMDVAVIAEGYGGGGHARASGFVRPIGWEGDEL